MFQVGTAPFRVLALHYGADIVYRWDISSAPLIYTLIKSVHIRPTRPYSQLTLDQPDHIHYWYQTNKTIFTIDTEPTRQTFSNSALHVPLISEELIDKRILASERIENSSLKTVGIIFSEHSILQI